MTDSKQNAAEFELNKKQRRWLWIIAACIIGLIVFGIATRIQAQRALTRDTDAAATLTVATLKPSLQSGAEEIVLPGDVQAFADAPIYARTSGYLQTWKVDIGARVKKGQLLAAIDAPEVDQQLLQAEADLATANANANLARSTAQRWTLLLESDSVSKQEADEKIGDAAAKDSLRDAARANVERLRQLQGFKRIVAPFDGVITARNIDIGALVSAASGTELFRISASEKLRVYIQVPQNYAPYITPGLAANLEFAERPGQQFAGKLVRSAEAIAADSRTLRAEIEVDNANAALLPGAYARVHLKLPVQPALRLPVNTLMFRSEGLRVAVVDAQQHIQLKPIQIGRDYGGEVEIVAGLSGDDNVVLNPPDALVDKQLVRVVKPDATKTDAE